MHRLNNIGDTLPAPITIYANRQENRTGVFLSAERTYKFFISDIEEWHDQDIENVDPTTGWLPKDQEGLSPGKKHLLNLSRGLCYIPNAGYMELVGNVNKQRFRLGNMTVSNSSEVSEQKKFKPRDSGELIVRANEPMLLRKLFYSNNSGKLKLQVLAFE